MKKQLITLAVAGFTLLSGSASAVTVFFSATSQPGSATVSGADGAGRVIRVATSLDLALTAPAAFADIINNGGTSGDFDTALAGLLGAPTAASPGIVSTDAFSGAFTFANQLELGDAGNRSYLFIVDEAGGDVGGIGVYQGSNVPAVGAASVSPGADTPIIGASDGGFQLTPVAAVPEPSIALLGALGVFGLMRRRR